MRRALGMLIGLAAISVNAQHYGAVIDAQEPIELETALAQLANKPAVDVVVTSTVDKVCEVRGCWLGLKSAASDLRVTIKNEAFFVPSSLIGKTVVVAGRLQKIVTPSGARFELLASSIDVIK